MAGDELLKSTIHVEVQLNSPIAKLDEVRREVAAWLIEDYDAVAVGQELHGLDEVLGDSLVGKAEISAYTGRQSSTGFYQLNDVQVDVQAYAFKDQDPRRSIQQASGDDTNYARVLTLPNSTLHDEWNSLVFDDGLPARLLRYLVRMIGMMRQPGLNMKTFNWNRLCLLHGPPGSGKSTLCRALAQKVTIRLGGTFANSYLVEINTNAMLSKYFGESGKLIASAFDQITSLAADSDCLVCVVMDEIETIAGLRENATSGNECRDGMRATNQLLTALDRLRTLPNVVVLCTSNLIVAIDPAFFDRVDIKQLVPSPSPAAIYNIFRSCLNELVRSSLVDTSTLPVSSSTASVTTMSSPTASKPVTRSSKAQNPDPKRSSSPDVWTFVSVPTIPTFSEMNARLHSQPDSPSSRVWTLARKCEGFSGRTLRRLPILGLAMYTGVGNCSINEAVAALEAAVDQEVLATKRRRVDAAHYE